MTPNEYLKSLRSVPVGVLAALLGLSERRVRELGVTHGWRVDRGRFDAVRAVSDYMELRASREPDLDLARERALLAQKQREKLDFDMAQKRRELIPAAWVAGPWDSMVAKMRQRVLTMAHRIIPLIQSSDGSYAELRRIFDDAVRDALADMSEFAEQVTEPKD